MSNVNMEEIFSPKNSQLMILERGEARGERDREFSLPPAIDGERGGWRVRKGCFV